MSKVKAGPVNADRLQSFIVRIERMEEEQAALASDKRDIYAEAKGVGYDVKTMRKVIALRKMDVADRDEQETLLDVYMHALGMIDRVEARLAAGEGIRATARAEGVSKSAVHRVSQKHESAGNGTHDADGVIVIAEEDARQGEGTDLVSLAADIMALPPIEAKAVVAVLDALRLQPEDHSTEHHRIEGEGDEREGNACADEGAGGSDAANGGRPVGAVSGDGRPDEGETRIARHPHGGCDAGSGDEAATKVTVDAVASTCERVATSNSVSAKIAHTDDDLAIPTFLRRPLPQVSV